jgi:hypothetical protein
VPRAGLGPQATGERERVGGHLDIPGWWRIGFCGFSNKADKKFIKKITIAPLFDVYLIS